MPGEERLGSRHVRLSSASRIFVCWAESRIAPPTGVPMHPATATLRPAFDVSIPAAQGKEVLQRLVEAQMFLGEDPCPTNGRETGSCPGVRCGPYRFPSPWQCPTFSVRQSPRPSRRTSPNAVAARPAKCSSPLLPPRAARTHPSAQLSECRSPIRSVATEPSGFRPRPFFGCWCSARGVPPPETRPT